MAEFKVLIARVNRVVDGTFVSHKMHEVVDLTSAEARRLLHLKAVAPVDADGNVTAMPEPDEQSPHLEPDLEDGQDTTTKPAGEPADPGAGSPEPGPVPAASVAASLPRGNASLEEWTAHAQAQGASDEDVAGLSRDQIREQYGQAQQA